MAQRPEFRRIVETIATEMTRKWISSSTARAMRRPKTDRPSERRLGALQRPRRLPQGGRGRRFFGRGHLYIALDGDQIGDELQSPIGNGHDAASKQKVRKGKLLRIQPVEACGPTRSVQHDEPTVGGLVRPADLVRAGKPIHRSRLLTFVGRKCRTCSSRPMPSAGWR